MTEGSIDNPVHNKPEQPTSTEKPLDQKIAAIFDRSVKEYEKGTVQKVYQEKFQELVNFMPSEDRDRIMVKLQKLGVSIRGAFGEYGSRFFDFVRNAVSWPLIQADSTYPKDKYYQMAIARAKAWTGFAKDTTKTATAERNVLKNHFLPSAITGAEYGALGFGIAGAALGATKGAAVGAATMGLGGAAVGAGLGAAVGGLGSIARRIKDRMIGPPIMYYNLDSGAVAQASVRFGSSISDNVSLPKSVI